MARTRKMNITDLVLHDACQKRVAMNQDVVSDYTAVLQDGRKLANVKAQDCGDIGIVVWDGFHTIAAHIAAGIEKISVDIDPKGKLSDEDALIAAEVSACGANASHGLRRTKADRHEAVKACIRLRPEWSVRDVANHVGVSKSLVQNIKNPPKKKDPAPQAEPSNVDTAAEEKCCAACGETMPGAKYGDKCPACRHVGPITTPLRRAASMKYHLDNGGTPASFVKDVKKEAKEHAAMLKRDRMERAAREELKARQELALTDDVEASALVVEDVEAWLEEIIADLPGLLPEGRKLPVEPAVTKLVKELQTSLARLRERTPVRCPSCEGEGCDKCKGNGHVLRRSIETAS